MNCDEWKAFLLDYLGGALSEPARTAIERHLSDCAGCFAEVRAHKLVDNHLRAQPVLDVPEGLVDRIVERAMPRRAPAFRRELLRMAAVFLAAVALGAAFVLGGVEERLPRGQVEAARRTVEGSIQGVLNAADLFKVR